MTGIPERKYVNGMINHFDTIHRPEVQLYKTYSYPEFRKKVISIFKFPDKTRINIKELMSAQQKPDESVLDYMARVQDNVAKAFPKLADRNRQDLAVSMFCQGLRDEEIARKTAIQAKGDVASALRIAASAKAFGKYQHYSQRHEPSRRRYRANVAIDDEQGDAEEEGYECDADADYEEQDEELLYAGPTGNFRGRGGGRRGRSRYGSRFGPRGESQPYAYSQGTAQQRIPTRSIAQGPPPPAKATSTTGLPSEQPSQASYGNPDIRCFDCK